MSSSKIDYKTLLEKVSYYEKLLFEKHNLSISSNSWYKEAFSIVESLIKSIKNNTTVKNNPDEQYWNKVFTSLTQLYELLDILSIIPILSGENLSIYLSKLEVIFDGPLLMLDENYNSSQSKNTLFELSLFTKLIKNNINAKLHNNHPDISFNVEEREYVVECKRIFKPETLLKNIKAALKQLKNYSMSEPPKTGICARYGIVAISLSRYIHSGNKLLDALSEDKAKERINLEMTNIYNKYRDQILNLFPVNIPVLLLEYSDRGSIDKPYRYSFIDMHNTAYDGQYSNFRHAVKDLEPLVD